MSGSTKVPFRQIVGDPVGKLGAGVEQDLGLLMGESQTEQVCLGDHSHLKFPDAQDQFDVSKKPGGGRVAVGQELAVLRIELDGGRAFDNDI